MSRAAVAAAASATVFALVPASIAAGTTTGPAAQAAACTECCADDLCQALVALADLRGSVDEFVPDGGPATSLDAKIDAATSSVLAGRPETALNELGAFDNEVASLAQWSQFVSNILKSKSDVVRQVVGKLKA